MDLKSIFGGANSVKYNKRQKKFTIKLDKDVANFLSVIFSAVPKSVGLEIKRNVLTFQVKDETLAMPVLEMLKSAGALK